MANNEVIKKAYDLLSRRAHSTQELRDKLYKRKFHKQDIETVLVECQRLNLLDDALFAKDYANELSRQSKGLFKIRMKLRGKGLSENDIEDALENLGDCEQENAEQALKGKLRSLVYETDINKRRQKAYRFLAYRGFASDIIIKLMNNTEELQQNYSDY